ncbi:PDZ domain-containing protein [Roseovarius sp. A21]|uniref:PDZ domain-containing protein n=1 Tax=Roseovarius bejariae TaxID=2576383 RepID=A0A844D4L6_9RHOB|nr:trypsin-like peptidase domain-containing protein [Roseovarius bejariae]MRU16218.1 PDZ domain-containing protein [Roseovarius bejariae]
MLRVLIILLISLSSPAWAETRVPGSQAEISMGFTPVVKRAAPAVVNIYARRIVNVRSSPFAGDPFFQNLFNNFGVPQQRVQNSLGSGVILSEDGIVVSNYHVVGEATDIRVVLKDRREFEAKVLLSDEESDLAILRMQDAPSLPALELRDSDTVEVGELVLAIGNPFGVGQTVSSGIVSGLARSGTATGNARGYFIQTDAPINPGNSGGALVDVNGQLIGINTSILSRSGGSNGIGFAIPSALVAQFVAQAKAGNSRFERPWAGLSGQSVTADMAEGLGLDRPGGIIISEVHPDSPFAEADIRPGDVITQVDGLPVNTPAEMIFRMSVKGLGEEVKLTHYRDGHRDVTPIRLIAAPNEPPRDQTTTGNGSAIPGLTLSTLNPAVIADYDLSLMSGGVVVDDPGQVGARAGLRRGDILLSINGLAPKASREAVGFLRDARNRLALEVQRGSRRLVMRFRL